MDGGMHETIALRRNPICWHLARLGSAKSAANQAKKEESAKVGKLHPAWIKERTALPKTSQAVCQASHAILITSQNSTSPLCDPLERP
jgi:hypothetical protein